MKGLLARIAAGAALASFAVGQVAGQSTAFEPVTDAMIQNPDPNDWLSWRRTLDSWGYSPLDQIDRENVNQLRMVWVRPLEAGHQEGTPLVHNGVMYFPGPSSSIDGGNAVGIRDGSSVIGATPLGHPSTPPFPSPWEPHGS